MRVNVVLSPNQVDELYFTGKTSVVIDVLRATSTILTALENGAREIIPVASLEFGAKISANSFGGKVVRGGEKNMRKIEGFDLGNSPLEYTREVIEGKTVVFFTTNGSKAIVKTKFSKITYIAAFLNAAAVAEKLTAAGDDVEIVCSGRGGEFSYEDTICAGYIIKLLKSNDRTLRLKDSAQAALTLYEESAAKLTERVKNSEHGMLLAEAGFEEDINYCVRLNVTGLVPVFLSNSIKK